MFDASHVCLRRLPPAGTPPPDTVGLSMPTAIYAGAVIVTHGVQTSCQFVVSVAQARMSLNLHGNACCCNPAQTRLSTDITGDTRGIIAGCTSEDVAGNGNAADFKPVLAFSNLERGIVLNKTNAGTIKAAYGKDTDEWVGKEVILFQMSTPFNGSDVPCIRMRVNKNAAINGDANKEVEI